MVKRFGSVPFWHIVVKICAIIFIVASIVRISFLQADLSEKKAILEQKTAEAKSISASNEQLEKLIKSGNYEQLIERALRENGYVKSDEKIYTDTAGN